MVSTPRGPRVRKRPEERRAEIVSEASRIALHEGLERITLRAVADRLGVRPGLVNHYFPAAEELVIAALEQALSQEREELLPAEGEPMRRLARLVARVEGDASKELSRLWLNARHLSRFGPALGAAIEGQEALDRERLVALIEDGVSAGVFTTDDPFASCVKILIAIDGVGSYVNNRRPFPYESYTRFVSDVTEATLGLRSGELRSAIAELDGGGQDGGGPGAP